MLTCLLVRFNRLLACPLAPPRVLAVRSLGVPGNRLQLSPACFMLGTACDAVRDGMRILNRYTRFWSSQV